MRTAEEAAAIFWRGFFAFFEKEKIKNVCVTA
jgi:hypothetical protein